MAREITVRIADRDYQIQTLTITKNREWRERLEDQLNPIITAIGDLKGVEVTDFDTLTSLAKTIKGTVMHSVDTVLDMLCAYAPTIEEDRTRIEAEGYDEEIFSAFGRVLGLVFPLGALTRGLTGPTASTISKNSFVPNTASTPTG